MKRVMGFIASCVALILMIGACTPGTTLTTAPPSTADATTLPRPAISVSPDTSVISGSFDIGGFKVWLECRGAGSPTVVVDTGLGDESSNWAATVADLSATTRTCRYDRAGLGRSEGPTPAGSLTAGDRVAQLKLLLDKAGIDGPYVIAGWSYGGMIARLFAQRFPAEVAGLVIIDSAHEDQFVRNFWLDWQPVWRDGAYPVDFDATRAQLLQATDLGSRPTIVLTQGDPTGELEREWAPMQDALAAMSSNSLHLVAAAAGHDINGDQPELVRAATRAVVAAVRSGGSLPACDHTFVRVDAECLTGTMSGLLSTWDAVRGAVRPAPGALPNGVYREELSGADVVRVTGVPADFAKLELDWSLVKGDWTVSLVTDGGQPESLGGIYAVDGDEVTFVLPDDWKVPRTPGVNRLRWLVDPAGTVTFTQVDDWAVEPIFLGPLVRTGDVP